MRKMEIARYHDHLLITDLETAVAGFAEAEALLRLNYSAIVVLHRHPEIRPKTGSEDPREYQIG